MAASRPVAIVSTLAALAVLLGLGFAFWPQSTPSDPPQFRRGINGDLWHDWRSIAELVSDPIALEVFPDWRRTLTPDHFRALSDQGFDFIRLPLDPGPALVLGPGKDQDRLIEGMHTATRIALDAGLNVVIDLHAIPRGGEPGGVDSVLDALWPDYVALTGRVAARLRDLPADRVALELLNEPTFDCEGVYAGAPARWPDMQAELHAAARAAAPDLTLVLTGACWSPAAALVALDPARIADANVLWTFHSYAPYTYTHQGAVWVGPPVSYLGDLPYPPSLLTTEGAAQAVEAAEARMIAATGAADRAAIEAEIAAYAATPDAAILDDIARAADWADRHGIPRSRILLGEFGALHSNNGVAQPREWYTAFLSDKRKAAEAAGFGWAVLSWAGDMGVADPADPLRRLPADTCRALGLPCGN